MTNQSQIRLANRVGLSLLTALLTHAAVFCLNSLLFIVDWILPELGFKELDGNSLAVMLPLILGMGAITGLPFFAVAVLTFALSYLIDPYSGNFRALFGVMLLGQTPTIIFAAFINFYDSAQIGNYILLCSIAFGTLASLIAWKLRRRLHRDPV